MNDLIDHDLVENVRRFVDERVRPHSLSWNQDRCIPDTVMEELRALGVFGLLIPAEYGGVDCNFSTFFSLMEAIAAGDGGLSTLIHVHNLGTAMLIRRLGSRTQMDRWLPAMASGECIGAVCLTEPMAGSDVASIQSRARKSEGGWSISGTKQFISNGARAGIFIVLAQTEMGSELRKPSFFLLPSNTPGLAVGAPERKMGQQTSDTTQIHFDECFVPDDAMLGEPGGALSQTLGMLSDGRISVAAQAIGLAAEAYALALTYAKERRTFGKPIIEHQSIGFQLAEMHARIDMAKVYTYHVARLLDEGRNCATEASVAKLVASQMAERVCSAAIQIHGGNGYLADYRVEQIARDARVCQIYEGTNEIQKLIISRRISR